MNTATTDVKKILVTGGTGLVGKALQSVIPAEDKANWIFLGSKHGDLRYNYF